MAIGMQKLLISDQLTSTLWKERIKCSLIEVLLNSLPLNVSSKEKAQGIIQDKKQMFGRWDFVYML